VLIESKDIMKKILSIQTIYGPTRDLQLIKDIVKSVVKETKEKAGK